MRITNVTIEKFRSIHQMDFVASPLTAICGPNSCGKSNVLRAIKFAFLPSFNADRMADNICHDVVGGNAACQVKFTFDSPTPALAASLGVMVGHPFTYSVKPSAAEKDCTGAFAKAHLAMEWDNRRSHSSVSRCGERYRGCFKAARCASPNFPWPSRTSRRDDKSASQLGTRARVGSRCRRNAVAGGAFRPL